MREYKYVLGKVVFSVEADDDIARYLKYRVSDIIDYSEDTYDVRIRVNRCDIERINLSDDRFIDQQEPDIHDGYYYREIMDLGIFRYDRAKMLMEVQYIDSDYYPFDPYEVVVDTILQFVYLIMLEFSIIPLHTAVLAKNDMGIMLFGNSGAGKSTLESALLCSGFEYFADDVAFMSTDGCIISSKERILGCSTETMSLIKALFNKEFESKNTFNSINKKILLVDESIITKKKSLMPRLIIFPQKNQAGDGLVEVSSKDTLIRLIKMTISEFFSIKQKQLYLNRLRLLSQEVKAYEYRWSEKSDNLIEVCDRIKSECEKES